MWSPWIASDPVNALRTPLRTAVTLTQGSSVEAAPGDATTQIPAAQAVALGTPGDATTSLITGPTSTQALVAQSFIDHTPGSEDTATAGASLLRRIDWFGIAGMMRNTFPSELDDLTYGVDYIEIPGTSDYIEYEDDTFEVQASDIQGWTGVVTVSVVEAEKDSATPDVGEARVALFALSLPTDPDGTASSPIIPAYGGGGTLATLSGAAGATVDADIPTSTDTLFAVVTEPAFTPWGTDHDLSAKFSVVPAVRVLAQPARWRYWIPRPSHVRLLHRGDGLGMNAKRLRTGGTTNQAGRLRGSY